MRGQAAVEYMAMIGILLAILLPLAAYVWQSNSTSSAVQQATMTADKIAQTADSLWAQGPGAQNTINVYFPPGYNASRSSLNNTMVRLSIRISAGNTDIVSTTKANLTGTLPSSPGYAWLIMRTMDNYVTVSTVS